MGTPFTHGLSATKKIAISGTITGGKVIEVGSLDTGAITLDGTQILTNFPDTLSWTSGRARTTVSYNSNVDAKGLPDNAANRFEKRIVHIDMRDGLNKIFVTVYRWRNYIDLRIQMKRQRLGQDGVCGNNNGNPDDDTVSHVFRKVGVRVPPNELLFRTAWAAELTEEMRKMVADCARERPAEEQKFRSQCAEFLQAELGRSPTNKRLEGCVLDYCYGDNPHARLIAERE